jgi:hypothetical protein
MAITDPTDIANLLTWCDAESLTGTISDGGTIETWTKAGGSVASSPTQSTPANRPTLEHGVCGGKAAVLFDSSNSTSMTCGAVDDYNAIHDGTGGGGFILACVPADDAQPDRLAFLMGTSAGSTANVGFSIWQDDRSSASRDDAWSFHIARGVAQSGTFNIASTATSEEWPANVWVLISWRYADNSGDDYAVRRGGVEVAGGAQDFTPSTADASSVLTLGVLSTLYATAYIAEFALWGQDLSDSDLDDIQAYVRAKYGVAVAMPGEDTPSGSITTIATDASEPDHLAFPFVTTTASGLPYVTYRAGTTHVAYDGIIQRKTCNADGTSLSSAVTLVDTANDVRAGAALRLANGSRMVCYPERTSGSPILTYARISASDDDSFGSATAITTNYDDFVSSAGKPFQLSNGNVYFPQYGKDSADTYMSCELAYTDDNGATWETPYSIADGDTWGGNLTEPYVVVMDNGDLVCFIRDDTNKECLRTVSTNSGVSWSSLTVAFRYMESRPGTIQFVDTSDNEALCMVYRDTRNSDNAYMRFSRDAGVTWSDAIDIDSSANLHMTYGDFFDDNGSVYLFWGDEDAGQTEGEIKHRLAFTYDATDTTKPTVQSASINTAGTQYTIVYDEPVTGQTGHTLSATGGAVTLTPSSGDGTDTHVWSLDRTILKTETATRSYTPGNAQDGSGNTLDAYSGQAVTNGSGMPRPTVSTAAIDVAGDELSLMFPENVTGQLGWILTATDGAVTATGDHGDGTESHSFSLSRVIGSHEVVTLAYDSATGNAVDDDGLEVADFADYPVTNESAIDTVDPELSRAQINGEVLTLTFSEAVTGQTAFTLTASGGALTLSSPTGDGTAIHTHQLSREPETDETITLDYNSGSGTTQDAAGNTLAAISDFPVTFAGLFRGQSASSNQGVLSAYLALHGMPKPVVDITPDRRVIINNQLSQQQRLP